MKYRLVIDTDAGLFSGKPWYVVQQFIEAPAFFGGNHWDRVDSGSEEYCRRIYERLVAGKEKYTVVEESA